MSKLLHISASPRGDRSESLGLGETFLATYRTANPGAEIDTWDLWDGTLPAFGPAAANAKMTIFAGQTPVGDEAYAWDSARAAFERFNAYDRYLFTVPMWNSGVPYILKQFIDVVSQPGMAFSFDATTGYTGLLSGKKAAVIYTGAVYGEGRGPAFGLDYQQPFFRSWLNWAGITDVAEVAFRPNLVTADAATGREIARAALTDLAKTF
ncbi:MAG: flavodoxin family protein [Hamadaea sp.]|uniref:FMN-dependent NADH-azoreductase n=1 Tax=Hamadaea sp. TaxID=2024425 RepID=UPI00179AE908|nr:NAD(P)H-dependent oxidoreductase [Hamadaea sp.]NUT19635.1 flavodoxin family protein [Hamadaea sp.]